MLRATALAVVDYILPPRCAGCATVVPTMHSFCVACWQQLRFLPPDAADAVTGCDATIVRLSYGPVIRDALLQLKYARRPGMAVALGKLVAPAVVGVAPDALLVPVPLHRWRMWTRAYNQAALLARAIGAETGHVVACHALHRTRATPPLRGLGPIARARAVRDAFVADRSVVAGRQVLLIDDVLTTGATFSACAQSLRTAGATRVTAVAVARAIPDD